MLERDLTALATAEGRMVGTVGHDIAKDYIVERLRDIGVQPYSNDSLELLYSHQEVNFVNVVGQIEGVKSDLPPILLGAHYDTCGPYPGADDNAAAVAVLLAVAEQLSQAAPDRTAILAFFDAEEPPYFLGPAMGSIRFFEDQLRQDIHCAIVMDLVGHDLPVPGLEDLLFVTGMESDPGFQEALKAADPGENLRIVPTLNLYVGDLSDHYIFRMNKRPYLLLTCGRWDHYHMPSDTVDRLNLEKIRAVADYLGALVKSLSFIHLNGPFEGVDTTEAELHFMRKNLLPSLSAMGLDVDLGSRHDIDKLVRMMILEFDL
jgi:hypothetical protein